MTSMLQEAPYPQALADLVDRLDYKGWTVYLADIDRGQGSAGLTLVITREGPDTYHPERVIAVNHYMPVPPAAFNAGSWQRWLFEQFLLVERHECAEFFLIGGERPFAPNHGFGEDPYTIHDLTTGAARRTSFRNVLDDDGTGAEQVMSAQVIAALRRRADALDASVPKVPVPVYDDRAMPSPYDYVTHELSRALAREFRARSRDEAEGYKQPGPDQEQP